jgi:uncharacterized protein YdeI (YjbR/CyaY-like superfamily)
VAEITETCFAPDRASWRAWLEQFGMSKTEIWLVLLKRHVPEPSVTYDEAVEEALCFGWIDGILKRIDDRSHAVRFSPRKPRSIWSQSNKARVARMIAEGRMTPTGMRPVETAKANGMWDATTPERIDVTPPDLEEALAADPAAAERWRTWPPSHRRQYIYWVLDAKRPETRARRIVEVVRRAAADIKASDL